MWPKRKASSPAKLRASGLISPLRTSAWRRPATSPTSSGGERSATAPHQKTCPITAARCSTASSSSPSRSRRAASTAWTVSGTRSASTAASGSSRPSRSTRTPSSTSIRSISSRKSGLPPVARPIASAASGSSGPARFSSSVRACSRGSGASWIVAPSPRRPQLREVRARHAADEDRCVATPAGEVLDEVEERRLRPLDVVEHEHERPLARERLEQPADRPVELVRARAWLRPADGLEDAPARRLALGLAAEHRLEVEVAYHLDERPVGDPVAVRQTAALEHERVLARGRDQLRGEAGLADARLADDRDDPAGAVGGDSFELRQQRVELGLAPDQRRVHPPCHPGRVRLDVEQKPGVDRIGLPLQLQRRHRLDRDRVTDETDRRVPDEDLTGGRGRLEPLRDDDSVARRERIALRRIAGEHLTRVDAGAHPDPDPVLPLELVVQAGELATELDRGPHRTQRIVLVHDRDPEHAQHGVADELLDRAAVPLEHRPRGLVIARPDAPERLRVELLAKRRRVRDVAEDERDRLPDHEGESRAVLGP